MGGWSALDRLLQTLDGEAVVAGGWAVWRHGYLGRVTQDVDIVVPAGLVDALIRAASVGGFEVPPRAAGMWPSFRHRESDIQVDLLPEGATPGSRSRPAPTTIPHPSRLGARPGALRYIDLAGLVELKLAAGRVRDESDVVELMLANPDQIDAIRQRLAAAHAQYVARFDELLTRRGNKRRAEEGRKRGTKTGQVRYGMAGLSHALPILPISDLSRFRSEGK